MQHSVSKEDGNAGSRRSDRLRVLGICEALADEALDRFSFLATRITESSVAMINFATEDRQLLKGVHFSSKRNDTHSLESKLDEKRELSLSQGFCQYVVTHQTPLVIEDTYSNPRFANNSVVRDWGLCSYLGVPLFDFDSTLVLGTLSVWDYVIRPWSASCLSSLSRLSGTIMSEIRLRDPRLIKTHELTRIMDGLPRPVLITSGPNFHTLYTNPAFESEFMESIDLLSAIQRVYASGSRSITHGVRASSGSGQIYSMAADKCFHPYKDDLVLVVLSEALNSSDIEKELASLMSFMVSHINSWTE